MTALTRPYESRTVAEVARSRRPQAATARTPEDTAALAAHALLQHVKRSKQVEPGQVPREAFGRTRPVRQATLLAQAQPGVTGSAETASGRRLPT